MGIKEKALELLKRADVEVNGSRPWDIKVHDESLYRRALLMGSLGLGEAYMDGWWDCEALDQFFYQTLRVNLRSQVEEKNFFPMANLRALFLNLQNKRRAHEVIKKHYDLGNDLFTYMLDKEMNYSCAFWEGASDLNAAQRNKHELICRKLNLKPGMKVLEIGCGFGGFAKYAAERYGVEIVGITLSKNQYEYAAENCKGLPVKILLKDYRSIDGKYDAVVSIAMFEAVGYKNHRLFMETVSRCLKDEGVFVLHTIGSNMSERYYDPWYNKYIFPNGFLPSMRQIGKAMEGLFVIEDVQNIGPHYYKTLMAWNRNFNEKWHLLKEKYGERFKRMWNYYLLLSAGIFLSRQEQVWHFVVTKPGREQPLIVNHL